MKPRNKRGGNVPATSLLVRQVRLAWRFRVWPWRVPKEAARYLSLTSLTEDDIRRTHVLAGPHGWIVADRETPVARKC